AYADALIDHRTFPVLTKKSGAEITNLIKTINDFHSWTMTIKPDEVLKEKVLKKVQTTWISDRKMKDPIKPSWFRSVIKMLEQPSLRSASITIAILLFIVSGVFGIILSLQPGSQVLQGTAESWKNGLIIGMFVLASIILIWMFIKDKK
ncbi:MAG: hypothetical protein WCF08_05315, partial [Anaerolineaceae bacterium]